MRGEEESKCLTRVRQYVNCDSVQYFCGNRQKIACILKNAEPNPAQSKFPDFIFKNGFIEQFQITSSKEIRKGASLRREQERFRKEAEQQFQVMCKELEQAPPGNELTREICYMKAPEFSYEMYEQSFRRNWQNHIDSLEKYTGCREVGIFLISYQGPLFRAIQQDEFLGFYQLNQDARMLRYIRQYQDKLSHVIFEDGQHCEVIELEKIPALIQRVPQNIQFEPGRLIKCQINTAIDMIQ